MPQVVHVLFAEVTQWYDDGRGGWTTKRHLPLAVVPEDRVPFLLDALNARWQGQERNSSLGSIIINQFVVEVVSPPDDDFAMLRHDPFRAIQAALA